MEIYSDKFVEVNSFVRAAALVSILAVTFALTFVTIPFMQWQLHFFQAGIFMAAMIFGPFAGMVVGALSSSYSGILVLHNPWIIGGNAILGLTTAYFYTRMHPMKAAMAAYAVQLPYLAITDIYLMHMPVPVIGGIIITLFVENLICAFAAMNLAPQMRKLLASS